MRILITRHDKIGDFVTALPMCKVLKEHTNYEVIMLVSRINVEIANNLDFIDEVIEYDENIFELSKRIKKKNIDVSISAFIDVPLGLSLILAGVKTRIAPATKIAQIFFNKTLKQKRSLVQKTEWQYNLDLIKYFDSSVDTKFRQPLVDLKREREDFVIFHVGSGGSSDGNLSLKDYMKLAKKLSQTHSVIFTFGPDDGVDKEYIERRLDFPAELRDDFKSLWEFTLFISRAKMFVSTSTGPMHLAGLTNTPTFSFFGSNLFASSKRWATVSTENLQNNFEVKSNYTREFYNELENKLYNMIIKG